MANDFKDYFSKQASLYAQFRPVYPKELFQYLATLTEQHDLCWDCASGNGQAAHGLANFFTRIVASDASEKQISLAKAHDTISFRVMPAEKTDFDDHSVDLITVAQAFHWFDFDKFFKEAQRVLKKNGVLAVWCYELMYDTQSPELNDLIENFYRNVVGFYWPHERSYVENGYADIKFPFTEIATPSFTMMTNWTLDHVLGYFDSWSSSQNYAQDKGVLPTSLIRNDMIKIWGDPATKRQFTWPLKVRVGRF